MLEKIRQTVKPRRRWLILAGILLVACVLLTGGVSFFLVQNVPGIARYVYGDPPSPTAAPTQRALVALPPTATLTPTPTVTTTPTLTRTPTAVERTFTPSPTAPSPTTRSRAVSTRSQPAEELTALPSFTPTPEPPTPTPRPPTPTPVPQWLAFETTRGALGDYEIFAMTPSGSRLTNLTNSWADDAAPVWSPDGRRVAFVSWRDTVLGKWNLGSGSIYLVDFDPVAGVGGKQIRLTRDGDRDGWPTWSPDGRHIAFESKRSGNMDIWVINVDGSGLRQLTNHPKRDLHPAWSPDGKKIAFTSARGGNFDIWVMNADGSNPVNLTNTPGRDQYSMWSPDGTKISFSSTRDGDQEIYVMNADGSNQRNVVNSPDSTEGMADWAPEGNRLVLYSNRSGNKDIFILDLVTGEWTNITKSPSSDEFCTWSP